MLKIIIIYILIYINQAQAAQDRIDKTASSAVTLAAKSFFNPFRKHHGRTMIDSLGDDVFHNVAKFLDLDDLKRMKLAYPNGPVGMTSREVKIIKCVKNHNKREFQRLLQMIDPAFHNNYLLRLAASKGLHEYVQILLDTGKVDVDAVDDWALVLAEKHKGRPKTRDVDYEKTIAILHYDVDNDGRPVKIPTELSSLFLLAPLIEKIADDNEHPMIKYQALEDMQLLRDSISKKDFGLESSLLLDLYVDLCDTAQVDELLKWGANPILSSVVCPLLTATQRGDLNMVNKLLNSKDWISWIKSKFSFKNYFMLERIYPLIGLTERDKIRNSIARAIFIHKSSLDFLIVTIINIAALITKSPLLYDMRAISRIYFLSMMELNFLKRYDPNLQQDRAAVLYQALPAVIFTGYVWEQCIQRYILYT